MSRELNDHSVAGVTDGLKIEVLDDPGAGGACHRYYVTTEETPPPVGSGMSPEDLEKAQLMMRAVTNVYFQNGPIKESGVNGITHEVLLAIVIDRLRSFQAGDYACRENAIALTNCEQALMWLKKRTSDRLARGVEGTNVK